MIEMQYNALSVLRDDAFKLMTSLHTIFLDFNVLSFIETHAFRGLINLRRLSLYSNKIFTIDLSEIPGGTLVDLKNNPLQSMDDLQGFPEAPVYMFRRRIDVVGEGR